MYTRNFVTNASWIIQIESFVLWIKSLYIQNSILPSKKQIKSQQKFFLSLALRMAKTTWIPPRFKNQLHCGIVAGGGGWSQVSQPGLDLITVAPNCHGKTKNLTQNQKPHGKNKIPHGKTENLTAKTKYLTTKPKTSRQNQRPHGKTKYFTAKTKYLTAKANTHCKTKAILLLPCSIWFCREVFCYCREVFVFAVTVVGHHKFAIASNVRIYAVNGFRRIGEGGGGGSRGSDETPFGT